MTDENIAASTVKPETIWTHANEINGGAADAAAQCRPAKVINYLIAIRAPLYIADKEVEYPIWANQMEKNGALTTFKNRK